MGANFTLDTEQLSKFRKQLRGVSRRLKNPRVALNRIAAEMKRDTTKTFRAQKDPVTGKPWKKTGDLAIRTRPKSGRAKTLLDTAQLLRSITSSSPHIGRDSVTIGSNLPYARTHQSGKRIVPKTAKFLAIPLTKEARRAGRARRWWQQKRLQAGQGTSSGIPFILKNVIVIRESTGKITAHWLLKKSVLVPRRRFLGISKAMGRRYAGIILRYALQVPGTSGRG